MMAPHTDLSGTIVGKLTVIEFAGYQGRHRLWRCICACGTEKKVLSYNLTGSLPTRSCGCMRAENLARKQAL